MRRGFFRSIFLLSLTAMFLSSCTAFYAKSVVNSGEIVLPKCCPSGWRLADSALLLTPNRSSPSIVTVDAQGSIHVEKTDFPVFVDVPYNDDCVRWSPDGQSILYRSVDKELDKNTISLHRIDLPETRDTMIVDSGVSGCAAWSPDSAQYIVPIETEMRKRWVLRSFNKSDGSYSDILDEPWDLHEPAWSPNGRYIAYTVGGLGSSSSIRVFDLQSKKILETGDWPTIEGSQPTWSPSGWYIAYIGSPREYSPLKFIGLSGLPNRILAGYDDQSDSVPDSQPPWFMGKGYDISYYLEPMWSPRGDYIAAFRIRLTSANPDGTADAVLVRVPEYLQRTAAK